MSGIVYSRSVRVAGNEMDEAVMHYLKRKYNLLVGERTAEQIKMEIGSAYPLEKPLTMEVKGRNLIEGVPRTVTIDDSEIREALSECVATILNACRVALERTPPSFQPISATAASFSPVAARCSRISISASVRRPVCRSRSRMIHWHRSCLARARCSAISGSCAWCPSTNRGRQREILRGPISAAG